ncbi:ankyrin [Hesseltinella vesiculosa]|uniref:Ankyrin n=1 Tax=Hesseltinella vesiculosa TaxID=101127 RepID=A0A1X2G7Q9_9FUNG|nr:ankyrin [Hesseltinella vesiculosa]
MSYSLFADTSALKDFYIALGSLGKESLQERLCTSIDQLLASCKTRHDDLSHSFQALQARYDKACKENTLLTKKYQKSLREIQFYRDRYESLAKLTARSCFTSSAHTNDTLSRPSSLTNNDSTLLYASLLADANVTEPPALPDDEDDNLLLYDPLDLMAVIEQAYLPPPKDPPSFDLPLPPIQEAPQPNQLQETPDAGYSTINPSSPSLSPLSPAFLPLPPPSPSTPIDLPSNPNQPPTTQRKPSFYDANHEQPLKFACGDGFWHTIATGRHKKDDVLQLIKSYLDRGGQVNVANNSGNMKALTEGDGLIHGLILVRNTAALQYILEAGANPEALPLRAHNQYTPLILAARLGYLNGVRLLVERCRVDMMAAHGPDSSSLLHAATTTNALELVEYLVRMSDHKLLHEVDDHGATVLHYACKGGHLQLITYFVRECGLSPNMTDYKGETPLHYCIRNRRAKAVVKLVGHLGAHPNMYVLKTVPTPLDLAKAGGLFSMADYLKNMGAKTTKELEKAQVAANASTISISTHHPSVGSSSSSCRSSSSACLTPQSMQPGRPLSVSGLSTTSAHTSSSSGSSHNSILSAISQSRNLVQDAAVAVKHKLNDLIP